MEKHGNEDLENYEEVIEDTKSQDSFFTKLNEGSSQVVNVIKKGTEETIETVSPYVNSFAKATVNVFGSIGNATKKVAEDTVSVMSDVKKDGILKSKLRKEITNEYNNTVTKYQQEMVDIGTKVDLLYKERIEAIELIKVVESYINELSNTPKEFLIIFEEINLEIIAFEKKQEEILTAESKVKLATGGVGAGASMSALGVAVATLGPTAAMSIATTFGVASTGTAISALSGAAATSASLAWLGGGALAVGGGGTAAGTALLALAGPIGWTLAGLMATTSVGLGALTSKKNKEQAEDLVEEIKIVEDLIIKVKPVSDKVDVLEKATIKQVGIVENSNELLTGTDYSKFSIEEKYQAGHLVNSTLALTKLINEEVSVNE